MRRIRLILAAATSMAVLMMLTAAPALADVELKQSAGGSGSTNVGNVGNGSIKLNGGDIGGSGGGITSVGNVGGGQLEVGGTDIGDNNIDVDNGCVLVLTEEGLFCVSDVDDGDINVGSGGVSQEFEEEDVESGDVAPSISIG